MKKYAVVVAEKTTTYHVLANDKNEAIAKVICYQNYEDIELKVYKNTMQENILRVNLIEE